VFEDSVEDREQLAHAGHQGNLLGFAGRQKTLVEFLHYRVATRGDQGAHVQRSSDLGSTSPHATMAAQGARVAVERSDPNQGGHSLVRERAQLGHSSQSRVRARTGPTPGTLRRSASFSPKAGLLSITASRSPSVRESSFWSHLMWALMRLATGLAAEDRLLFSAAIIPSSCLRRATMASKARISRSGRGFGAGRTY
jgi:hypothetical protein